MEMQKLGAAREGSPLEFARRGDSAGRVRGVERWVKGGLRREAEGRYDAEEWKGVLGNVGGG